MTATLTISSVQMPDIGNYTVAVTNPCGSITSNCGPACDIVQNLLARKFLRNVHCVQQIIA